MAEGIEAIIGAVRFGERVGCMCPLCQPGVAVTDGADARAKELLLSFLDDAQKKQLHQTGRFQVVGSDGVTYGIDASGYSGNITEFRNGKPHRGWCGYPRYMGVQVPLLDRILGQYLALKTEAHRFRAVAY